MTRPTSYRPLVLGIHPTARGFGWAVMENPLVLHSFGVFHARGDKNAGCLRKIRWLLERLEPEQLILEAFDERSAVKSERIRRLCLSIVDLVATHGSDVKVFTRLEVQQCFSGVGARSRQEIAEAVARHAPALRPHLPKKRRAWDSADHRLSLFGAAALALAHYHYEATAFLNEMRDAA